MSAPKHLNPGLMRAAASGNAEAQNEVGAYFDSIGDISNAIFWFNEAAEQGLLISMHNLACKLYERGDKDRGRSMFVRAAKQLYPGSLYYMGNIYEKENDCRGITCWRLAAAQGHDLAEEALREVGVYDTFVENGQLATIPSNWNTFFD